MRITYENKDYEVQEGLTIREALKEQIEKSELQDIIAARLNNTIESLNLPLTKDHSGEIEFITRNERDGRNIYIRGLLFVMSKAFAEVYPDALLTVNYQLSNAMFGTVDNMEVTEEMISKVKSKMIEIVNKDIPILKEIMTQDEAEEFYKKETTIKGKLQTAIDKDKVSLYYCEDYYNYFYGTMPISTGFAKVFDLEKYRNGFLVKYPSVTEPNKIQETKESLKLVSAMDEYDEIYRLMKINTVHRLNKKVREPKGEKELILF